MVSEKDRCRELDNNESFYINKMEPLITFIIPTIGRPTLPRTLDSLIKLSNARWKAIVVFDGVDINECIEDPRIQYMKIDKIGYKNCAGEVRNHGMNHVTTEWIGFVDDDDIVLPNYVDSLISELHKNPDVIIFRMADHNLKQTKFSVISRKYEIITKPAANDRDFRPFEVGISFCMRSTLFLQGFKFESSHMEDYELLNKMRLNNKRIILSKEIGYVVRPD